MRVERELGTVERAAPVTVHADAASAARADLEIAHEVRDKLRTLDLPIDLTATRAIRTEAVAPPGASSVAAARGADRPGPLALAAAVVAGLVLALWALQIALNTLWTPVFFGAHRLGAAMLILAALWLVVAVLMVMAWRLDRLAGLLLLPYLAWLTLAGTLNFGIWQNSPGTTG